MRRKKLINFGLVYFAIFPFTPVFAINDYLTLPLLASFITFLFYLIHTRTIKINFLILTALSLMFCLVLIININVYQGDVINIFHLLAILACCFFYLIIPTVISRELEIQSVMYVITVVFVIISVFGIIDFYSSNFLNFKLGESLLYFPPSYDVGYGYFGGLFFRNKSIFQEPGFYAWYLNSICLLIIGYFINEKLLKKASLIFLLYLISMFLTFSASGFIIIFILLAFLCARVITDIKVLIVIVILTFLIILISYDTFIFVIENKIFGNSTSNSQRMMIWSKGLYLASENPIFGIGLGNFSLNNDVGLISFTLKLLTESGFISLLIFLLLFLFSFVIVLKSNISKLAKPFLLTAIIGNFIHWSSSTPFYFSFSWTFFLILLLIVKNHDKN